MEQIYSGQWDEPIVADSCEVLLLKIEVMDLQGMIDEPLRERYQDDLQGNHWKVTEQKQRKSLTHFIWQASRKVCKHSLLDMSAEFVFSRFF